MSDTNEKQESTSINDRTIHLVQGDHDLLKDRENLNDCLDAIKGKIAELCHVKNVSFLLGAGASSDSIPAMKEMLKVIDGKVSDKIQRDIFNRAKNTSNDNLEEILGTLYSGRSYTKGIGIQNRLCALIELIEEEIFRQINIDTESDKATLSINNYKTFFQKLSLRNKDLSRVCVFTTNNDLLMENALDHANINYNNGFGGGLNKAFNPARFTYTFSRKIDSSLEKYEPLENMIYLYKLHGSISWTESANNSFFNIQEISIKYTDNRPSSNVLIYPTPLKQNKSLGAPYSDLIREFQNKLLQQHTTLFIIGYSFSDEHINNVIYQSLASNSSISIVIFGNPSDKLIYTATDPRIYKIYGHMKNNDDDSKSEKIHYFSFIANNLLPDLNEHRDPNILDEFIKKLRSSQDGK